MLSAIRQFFETHIAELSSDPDPQEREHAHRLATAALLIEMTRADHEVKAIERDAVTRAIDKAFGLPPEETRELVALAELEADQATSLYEFTRLINQHFSHQDKGHIVELLWEVAYADGELDKYEEHLVRKLADLIHVPHSTFIRAKHRAREKLGGAGAD